MRVWVKGYNYNMWYCLGLLSKEICTSLCDFSVWTGARGQRAPLWRGSLWWRTSMISSMPCTWRSAPTQPKHPNTPGRRKRIKRWVKRGTSLSLSLISHGSGFMASCSLYLIPHAALFDRLYLSVTLSVPYSVSLIYFLCDSYEQKRAARGVCCAPAVCCPGVICSRESLASVSFGWISQKTH